MEDPLGMEVSSWDNDWTQWTIFQKTMWRFVKMGDPQDHWFQYEI